MENILEAPFLVEIVRTTTNMYAHGWDERNGGNISLLLDEAEVSKYVDVNAVIRDISTGFEAPALEGKYFLVTGTGKYFKNVQYDPAKNLGKEMKHPIKPYSHPGWERKRISRETDPHSCIAVRVIFFDFFHLYPLSNFRGYVWKKSKQEFPVCDFPQTNSEKHELFTKNSNLAEKWKACHYPPIFAHWSPYAAKYP